MINVVVGDFGETSSVKVLQWLTQYKKLSAKAPESLNDLERQLLKELEVKLAGIVAEKLNEQVGTTDIQKRESLRVETELQLRYSSIAELQRSYIKNISGGGVFIQTSKILEIGTKIKLEIVIPHDPEPISVEGEVAWTNPRKLTATPQGMGVKFLNLSNKDYFRIQKQVSNKIEKILKMDSDKSKKKS